MKKISALLLILIFMFMASCGISDTEEPFAADFTLREQNMELTSVVYDSDYAGATYVFDSDTLKISDVENFLRESLFTNDDSRINILDGEMNVALSGSFNSEDISSLKEISGILNAVPSFPGIREVSLEEANVIVEFSDTEGFSYNRNAYGVITDAAISIPRNLSFQERYALLFEMLFRVCGFVDPCDTEFDSVISVNKKADIPSDIDFLLLEAIYTMGKPEMSEKEILSAVKNYFITNSSEVLS